MNEEANATLVYEDPEEADAFRRQHNSRDVPLRFSVTAGEVLYHLRSSLDHLACDLIRPNGGCVTPQSQFPIFTFKPTKRKGMARYRDQVSGIAAEPAAMIEALQPYHRGEDGSAHFLAVLKSLSNFDKHNSLVLQSVRLKPSPKGVIGNDVMSLTTTRRDHGTQWRLNSGSGFEVMKMQRQLTACVMLGPPADLGGLPVIDVLRALHLFTKRTCMDFVRLLLTAGLPLLAAVAGRRAMTLKRAAGGAR